MNSKIIFITLFASSLLTSGCQKKGSPGNDFYVDGPGGLGNSKSLLFPPTKTGLTATGTETFTNDGDAPLTLSSIEQNFGGEPFSIEPGTTCHAGLVLSAGESCHIDYEFFPPTYHNFSSGHRIFYASGGRDYALNVYLLGQTLPPLFVTVNEAPSQPDPTNALPIEFTVVFSDPIDLTSFTVGDVVQSGTATGITWTITDSGDHKTFTLAATSVTTHGTLTPLIPAGSVLDLDGLASVDSMGVDGTVDYVP